MKRRRYKVGSPVRDARGRIVGRAVEARPISDPVREGVTLRFPEGEPAIPSTQDFKKFMRQTLRRLAKDLGLPWSKRRHRIKAQKVRR